MGVSKYHTRTGAFWKVDVELKQPDGTSVRFRKRKVPTREMAEALVAKMRVESFEGRYFDRKKPLRLTVQQAWDAYAPICRRDNRSWRTEFARAKHFVRHAGKTNAAIMTVADVERYRTARLAETTKFGRPPSWSELDREVELLKRIINFAVRCGTLPVNPIAGAELLNRPNVRRMVVDEAGFGTLVDAAVPWLRPILITAFDTGMRKMEILDLLWDQVDLKDGVVRLAPQDTKGGESRTVFLTQRVRDVMGALPRGIRDGHVFLNLATGLPYRDVRPGFPAAAKAAGFEGLWFHDLRRSFVTNARRRGIPESVVMKMSGHRTRAVFDRYNIVSERDLIDAIGVFEQQQLAELSELRQDSVNVADPPSRNGRRRLG